MNSIWRKTESGLARVRIMVRNTKELNDVLVSSDISTKVYKLGVEPSGWKDLEYDDSGWSLSTLVEPYSSWVLISGAYTIWSSITTDNEYCLFRRKFTVSQIPQTVEMRYNSDNDIKNIYINGIAVSGISTDDDSYLATSICDIKPYLQIGENVIAFKVYNNTFSGTNPAMLQFAFKVR